MWLRLPPVEPVGPGARYDRQAAPTVHLGSRVRQGVCRVPRDTWRRRAHGPGDVTGSRGGLKIRCSERSVWVRIPPRAPCEARYNACVVASGRPLVTECHGRGRTPVPLRTRVVSSRGVVRSSIDDWITGVRNARRRPTGSGELRRRSWLEDTGHIDVDLLVVEAHQPRA